MKETASVFKVMGMGKHIRRGDFTDSTQRTPVLIPLHKVLEIDKPEDEMRSYSAVRDVYHQRTKYANKVTGMTREKLVPLFARTTLVEKNGVTPGGLILLCVIVVLPTLTLIMLWCGQAATSATRTWRTTGATLICWGGLCRRSSPREPSTTTPTRTKRCRSPTLWRIYMLIYSY